MTVACSSFYLAHTLYFIVQVIRGFRPTIPPPFRDAHSGATTRDSESSVSSQSSSGSHSGGRQGELDPIYCDLLEKGE